MKKLTSRLRIAILIGIARFLIVFVGLSAVTAFSLYAVYDGGLQANLRKVEDMVFLVDNALEEPLYRAQQGEGSADAVQQTLEKYLEAWPEVRYAVLSMDGTTLVTGTSWKGLANETLSSPEIQEAFQEQIGSSIRPDERGVKTIFVASLVNHLGQPQGILVLAAPYYQRMAETYQTMIWVGLSALFVVGVILGEGYFSSRYLTRPIVRLSQAAEQLSQGDLSARAELEGPTEVVHLASTFNIMAARLQRSLDSLHAFVGNASHELRTPLTSMKLYVGALRDGALEEPEVAQRFLSQLESEIDRLVHMVNDMLDLSQIETIDMQPNKQFVNLNDLAHEVQAFWEVRSRQNGLELTLHAASKLPVIKGDPFRLRQMFDNLLDNAIKHTPRGGQIDIELFPCDHPRVVRIEIRDSGEGISPEHLPRLFERFYRIDAKSKSGQITGGGLGLAIVNSIVQAHGGQIGVNSLPGKGSTFWIELPIH